MKRILCTLIVLIATLLSTMGQQLQITDITIDSGTSIHIGDTILIGVTVCNVGQMAAEDCSILMRATAECVQFIDSTEAFSYIGAGNCYELHGCCRAVITEQATDGQIITLFANLNTADCNFQNHTSFQINGINLQLLSYQFTDNLIYNLLPDAGETDIITFQMENNGQTTLNGLTLQVRTNDPYVSILTGEMTIDTLPSSSQCAFPCTMNFANNYPSGHSFDVSIDCLQNGHVIKTFHSVILGYSNGYSFENGQLPVGMTTNTGTVAWFFDATTSNTGNCSLRSGSISHNDTTTFRYEFSNQNLATFSFSCKVSSESNYDWLNFYLDGTRIARWSGSSDWTGHTYSIAAGTHVAEWSYSKDASVSRESDCSWIDDIAISAYGNQLPSLDVATDSIAITLHQEHLTDSFMLQLQNPSDIYLIYNLQIGNDLIGWASLARDYGVINAHDVVSVPLRFNCTRFPSGLYHTELRITIDGLDTLITIPITMTVESGVGIDTHTQEQQLSLFPNPTNGVCHLRSKKAMRHVQITDLQGSVLDTQVLHGTEADLSLSHYPAGIYILTIYTFDDVIIREKIVKR